MKKVLFISGSSRIFSYTNMPLLVSKNILREKGYDVIITNKTNPKKLNCDILIIVSKFLFNKLGETERILSDNSKTVNFIKKCRKNCKKIIWFDNSDSTSITHFELMKYIDIYLKKQILKNKNIYRKKLIGGRVFTDYYSKKYKIPYQGNFSKMYPLSQGDEHKLRLGWNIGLGDVINSFGRFFSIYNNFFPDKNYNRISKPRKVDTARNLHIFLKTSENLSENIIAFHRKEMIKQLRAITKRKNLNSIIQGQRLNKNEFQKHMANANIMPSPFGWGELGARDYEAFYYGACLLKPSMDHMDSWPDIFISNETYIECDWDFSDLEEKIMYYINNHKKRKAIAENGQRCYMDSISQTGLENFSNHFVKQISE